MANKRRNRAGFGANAVDSFNLSMLQVLKTKQERLNLMERMSLASDNLNPSYLEKEPELQLGMHVDPNSEWAIKRAKLKLDRERNKTWIDRFTNEKLDQMNIVDTKSKSWGDAGSSSGRSSSNKGRKSGLDLLRTKVIKPPPVPKLPKLCKKEEIERFNDDQNQAVFCCKCWGQAGGGPRRVNCQNCANFGKSLDSSGVLLLYPIISLT